MSQMCAHSSYLGQFPVTPAVPTYQQCPLYSQQFPGLDNKLYSPSFVIPKLETVLRLHSKLNNTPLTLRQVKGASLKWPVTARSPLYHIRGKAKSSGQTQTRIQRICLKQQNKSMLLVLERFPRHLWVHYLQTHCFAVHTCLNSLWFSERCQCL